MGIPDLRKLMQLQYEFLGDMYLVVLEVINRHCGYMYGIDSLEAKVELLV